VRLPFKSVGRYLHRVVLGLDQFVNTLLGGAPDETMSSRFGRVQQDNPLARAVCWGLDKLDRDHCEDSVEYTPDGQPDAHHLPGDVAGGRVIHELPR
jgi:hypothetical protein